jgi:putative membrane protein
MNTIVRVSGIVLIAVGVLSGVRAGADTASLTDAEFVYKASEAGIVEVAMGRVALEKSKSSGVQRFALVMIADHDTANDELKILARKKGLTLVDEAAAADKAAGIAAGIKKENFDEAYANNQLKAHEEAVSLFSTAATQLVDADLKAYVTEKLPKWKHHLKMAIELVAQKEK